MDFEITRNRLSAQAVRNISKLVKGYNETGKLSRSVLASLKPFHDSQKTQRDLTAKFLSEGLDFNPFAGEEPANPHYQGPNKAPYSSPYFPCLKQFGEQEDLLPRIVGYMEDDYKDFDAETLDALIEIRAGGPDTPVAVYRVVPENKRELNPGDWITLSRYEAEKYLANATTPAVLTKTKVPASHIFWDMTNTHEFGYDPRPPSPERDVPSSKIDLAYNVLADIHKDWYNTGVVDPLDLQRLEKFYLNPETKPKFMSMLENRLGFDPFTNQKFERPLQSRPDRTPLHLIQELTEQPLGEAERAVVEAIKEDPEAMVAIYKDGPARLGDEAIFEPGMLVDLSSGNSEFMVELNRKSELKGKVARKLVPAKHLYCEYDELSRLEIYYEPRGE